MSELTPPGRAFRFEVPATDYLRALSDTYLGRPKRCYVYGRAMCGTAYIKRGDDPSTMIVGGHAGPFLDGWPPLARLILTAVGIAIDFRYDAGGSSVTWRGGP